MRTAEEIINLVKKKTMETAKNEVIALSNEEFDLLANSCWCPGDLNFEEYCHFVGCEDCWKKATGRK